MDKTEPSAQPPQPLAILPDGPTTSLCEFPTTTAGWISYYEAKLQPCGAKTGQAELAACLALVAPSGMGQAERATWFAVAREALKGIPEDLMKRGCLYARRHATHPAHVVPAIIKEVEEEWDRRKARLAANRRELRERQDALAAPAYEAIPREVTQRILREAMGGIEGEDDAGQD